MKNGHKYNATKVYWNERVGYLDGLSALQEYLNCSKGGRHFEMKDFYQFDSKFEAEVHKILLRFISDFNKSRDYQALALYSQVKVDLSQRNFCSLSYKIDFLVGLFDDDIPMFNADWTGIKHWLDPEEGLKVYKGLHPYFVEAKGMFLPESRFKHMLLESKGIKHGKDIDIVQTIGIPVHRGKDSYKTVSIKNLQAKLESRFSPSI